MDIDTTGTAKPALMDFLMTAISFTFYLPRLYSNRLSYFQRPFTGRGPHREGSPEGGSAFPPWASIASRKECLRVLGLAFAFLSIAWAWARLYPRDVAKTSSTGRREAVYRAPFPSLCCRRRFCGSWAIPQ